MCVCLCHLDLLMTVVGPVIGRSDVMVGGAFSTALSYACQVGDDAVPRAATLVNTTLLRCEAPPHTADESVPVTVWVSGTAVATSPTFRYLGTSAEGRLGWV